MSFYKSNTMGGSFMGMNVPNNTACDLSNSAASSGNSTGFGIHFRQCMAAHHLGRTLKTQRM